MRTPLLAGNWKMYKTPADTQAFFDAFLPLVAGATGRDAAICPPYIDLPVALAATAGSNVGIGAQNMAAGKEGAMTGEISGHMLKTIGVFQLKEHLAVVGLCMLPVYWHFWHSVPLTTSVLTRGFLTTLLMLIVWWNLVIGHLLNNVQGLT